MEVTEPGPRLALGGTEDRSKEFPQREPGNPKRVVHGGVCSAPRVECGRPRGEKTSFSRYVGKSPVFDPNPASERPSYSTTN